MFDGFRKADDSLSTIRPALRDRFVGGFHSADRDKHGNSGLTGVRHLAANALLAHIDHAPESGRNEGLLDSARVVRARRRHGGDRDLIRSQPQRQPPFVVLEQHGDEAFDATEHRVMDHHRPQTIVV